MLKPKNPYRLNGAATVSKVAGPPASNEPAETPELSEREKGLQELLHRLHTRIFAPHHVEEAAVVVSQVMTRADSLRLAQKYLTSPMAQVRQFATHLLRLAEAVGKPGTADTDAPASMGYSAIAEVVKQWIREESARKAR